MSSQATNGSEEENKGVIIDQELIELENCYRRKRRMAQRKEFSNSLILDKKKICENLWNLCDKKRKEEIMKEQRIIELAVKVLVAALTAFLTALGTTSCMVNV